MTELMTKTTVKTMQTEMAERMTVMLLMMKLTETMVLTVQMQMTELTTKLLVNIGRTETKVLTMEMEIMVLITTTMVLRAHREMTELLSVLLTRSWRQVWAGMVFVEREVLHFVVVCFIEPAQPDDL